MQISGTYFKTLYSNKQGIGVFLVHSENGSAYYQCHGKDPACYPGTPLTIYGQMVDGVFMADSVEIGTTGSSILIDYLSGGLFDGVGRVLAERIVEAIPGKDLFRYVKEHGKLPVVKGLSPERSTSIVDIILGSGKMQEFIRLCAEYGLDYATSIAIYARFEEDAKNVLEKKPYKLLREKLIDFAQADNLAKQNGIEEYGSERIEALIYQALYRSSQSGNTYIRITDICKGIDRICLEGSFSGHIPPLLILIQIHRLSSEHKLVLEESAKETRLYLNSLYEAEKKAAEEIMRLNRVTESVEVPLDADLVYQIEDEFGVSYDEHQRQAFGLLYTPGIKIITGGPGTGKTTVIKGLIRYMELTGKSFTLCAPTGRAAQRMAEVCGHDASTIHKLLEIRPYGRNEYRCRGKENPIRRDYVIVDEVSMVGVELFAQLLNAVCDGSTVILVGDDNQLASVTPGNVLKDLIQAGIETYRLKVVFRQKQLSSIAINAERIKNGNTHLLTGEDFRIAIYKEGELEKITKAATSLLSSNYDPDDMFNVQLLVPVKKGDAGSYALNWAAQQRLNPGDSDGIRKGDRVIFLENNYEQDYFNGDMATVVGIQGEEITLKMLDGIKTIPRSNMKDLAPAYAVTIHKSQGSEYENVIIVLPKCSMLARNLLYTAVTRAKRHVIILAEGDALERCIRMDKSGYRQSALYEKICAMEAVRTNKMYEKNAG